MIATIPVRVSPNQEQSVRDYLDHTQRQAIETIPFEQFGLQNIAKLSSDASGLQLYKLVGDPATC